MKTITLSLLAAGAAFAPSVASADPGRFSYAWTEESLQSKYGVETQVGGGVTGFTNQTMRDSVSSPVNGLWNVRVTLGSHTPLGVDIGYIGSAADINSLTGSQKGTLYGTTVEGALRYNVLPHNNINPYAFVGMGYQRYDISGDNFNMSDTGMNASDNSIAWPMGAGLSYRDASGFVADIKGVFRANTNQDLVLKNVYSTDFAPMHTWEASGAIGWEF